MILLSIAYPTERKPGRIVTSFPSILYFVADMFFKTNGRICFLEKNKSQKAKWFPIGEVVLIKHSLM